MLTTVERSGPSPEALEHSLEMSERLISQARAMQLTALVTLDVAQVAARDGARSLQDWVAARLDVFHETARSLVAAAGLLEQHPPTARALADGDFTFDRAIATAPLAASGADKPELTASRGYDVSGVQRLAARRTPTAARSERQIHDERYIAIQPSLDDARWKVWGQLPGIEGRVIEAALTRRGDALPRPPSPTGRG